MDLYAVYLGGTPASGRMGEDHEVVFVVARDVTAMKSQAKAKWGGSGRPHVDAYEVLQSVDGYAVSLSVAGEHLPRAVVDDNAEPFDED
jgi:hypothetical protein